MHFSFRALGLNERLTPKLPGQVFLTPSSWDDYSYKTSFSVNFVDRNGTNVTLGTVKIGYINQPEGWTRDRIPQSFDELPDDFFSLGQDVHYYKSLHDHLDPELRKTFLRAIRDVAEGEHRLTIALDQKVFINSLTRGVSASTVRDQFRRVLAGQPELTDFYFRYRQQAGEKTAPVDLAFQVRANSTPPTNVHVLIGRNGVGKTTLLNNMIATLTGSNPDQSGPSSQFIGRKTLTSAPPL